MYFKRNGLKHLVLALFASASIAAHAAIHPSSLDLLPMGKPDEAQSSSLTLSLEEQSRLTPEWAPLPQEEIAALPVARLDLTRRHVAPKLFAAQCVPPSVMRQTARIQVPVLIGENALAREAVGELLLSDALPQPAGRRQLTKTSTTTVLALRRADRGAPRQRALPAPAKLLALPLYSEVDSEDPAADLAAQLTAPYEQLASLWLSGMRAWGWAV